MVFIAFSFFLSTALYSFHFNELGHIQCLCIQQRRTREWALFMSIVLLVSSLCQFKLHYVIDGYSNLDNRAAEQYYIKIIGR